MLPLRSAAFSIRSAEVRQDYGRTGQVRAPAPNYSVAGQNLGATEVVINHSGYKIKCSEALWPAGVAEDPNE